MSLIALGLLALTACSGDSGDDTSATTTARERGDTTTSTVRATTTSEAAPPTTVSPLTPIEGCPAPGPLAVPDPQRPTYSGDISVDVTGGVVDGLVRVRFVPDLPVAELVFRLWPNSPRPAATGTTMSITSVRSVPEGADLATSVPDPTTVVVPVGEVAAGTPIEVDVAFRLVVGGAVSDRVSLQGDSLRLGSFLPLLAWEEGVGWGREPPTALFAEAVVSPAADFDLLIAVTEGFDVLATGTRGGDGRWRATAARDFAASVGRFTVTAATEALPAPVHVQVGVHDTLGEDPSAYLAQVQAALRDFASRYGAYPWDSFTLAITPGLDGGIEFPTHVMQGPGTLGRTTAHEVGHMWFYALVGNHQGRDPWLDEGLASYLEFVHEDVVETNAARAIPSDAQGRAAEPMTYWEEHRSSYYRGVYVQPAVAIASLGDASAVACALRRYVADNAFAVARPGDLFAALETVFPDAAARLASAGLHP